MLPMVFLYAGSIVIALWGVAHIIPVKNVMRGFGDLSQDNRLIVAQMWVSEGLTLVFIGVLVIVSALVGGPENPVSRAVHISCAAMLVVGAVWHLFAGARTAVVPMKVCPAVMLIVGAAFFLGAFLPLSAPAESRDDGAQGPGATSHVGVSDPAPAAHVTPDRLVSVTLHGVSIDVLPQYVDVFVADPHAAVEEMMTKGATRAGNVPNTVFYEKVLYSFFDPESLNKRFAGRRSETGDVVYHFFMESPEDRRRFIREYGLKDRRTFRHAEGPAIELFVLGSGRFALLPVRTIKWTCSMHPQVKLKKAGICPICEMPLMSFAAYE